METRKKPNAAEKISWSFHPRVFTSLGAELVTNDFVALVELVKNAYDAFARRVDIRFLEDEISGSQTIEVQDDGHGMDRQTIVNSWCMVGTPYKTMEVSVTSGKKTRRVTGEKGLGRLSVARLGGKLRMYTKKVNEPCFRVDVDWDIMAKAASLAECDIEIRQVRPPKGLENHGTLLQIQNLKKIWDFGSDADLPDLSTELARFAPPFQEQIDFNIYLTLPGEKQNPICVQPPEILSRPPYIVKGTVDKHGMLIVNYQYQNDKTRNEHGALILSEKEPRFHRENVSPKGIVNLTECGPFEFEFRVWDFDRESLIELGKRFELGKKVTEIRGLVAESPFNGISLYRDGVLVLPKESGGFKKKEAAGKDWLGLNLRRVSRVGKRVSANQIIGYVNISADDNPNIRDTADRERLVDNISSRQFREFLFKIVEFLEQERDKDHSEPSHREPPLKDLFEDLRSLSLPKELEEIKKRKGGWSQIQFAVADFTKKIHIAVDEIQQRFFYYSRIASVGSLAMLLQHEVGNKIPVISQLHSYLRKNSNKFLTDSLLIRKLELSENSVRSLQRLADLFSPLASRTFGIRRRNSNLEDIIRQIAEWHEKEIHRLHVELEIESAGSTIVAVDPGEVAPIIDNLMNNSLYWLTKVPSDERNILVEIAPNNDGTRAEVKFHDSGPGIDDGYEEKIFWPGITKKEEGIGMGLTVASEIVAQQNGKMYLIKPGDLGGASFVFDLPLARKK